MNGLIEELKDKYRLRFLGTLLDRVSSLMSDLAKDSEGCRLREALEDAVLMGLTIHRCFPHIEGIDAFALMEEARKAVLEAEKALAGRCGCRVAR